MKKTSISSWFKTEKGVIAAAFILLAAIAALNPPFLTTLEGRFVKFTLDAMGGEEAPKDIIIIDIDRNSLDEIGKWPWNQRTIVGLIGELTNLKVKLIMLDADVSKAIEPSSLILGKKQLEGPPIVMGYKFYPTLADLPSADDEEGKGETPWFKKPNIEGLALPAIPINDSKIRGMMDIEESGLPNALRDVIKEGFTNVFPDGSGLVTNATLAVRYQGRIFPSLPLVTYARWRGFTPIVVGDSASQPIGISIGDEKIESRPDLDSTIGFRIRPNKFKRISAADIMLGKISPIETSQKIALVGLSRTTGVKTPIGMMDDLELSANILSNMFTKGFIRSYIDRRYTIPALLILAIIYAFGLSGLKVGRKIFTTVVLIAASVVFGCMLLWFMRIWTPVMGISIACLIFLLSLILWKKFAVDMPLARLARDFGWRLSRSNIERLLREREVLDIDGYFIEIASMAVDIKGFGLIASSLDPQGLISFIREYRILVSETMLRFGGMIESWNADDARAAFGAPFPLAERSLKACLAAIELRRSLLANMEKWSQRYGIDKVKTSIGIYDGTATAGDFGLGFNIIGGASEAALQLRKLNRMYRTWALVDETVYEASKTSMEYRALDRVILWGEKGTSRIYELIGESGTIHPASKPFEQAMSAYMDGRFETAAKLFKDILDSYPHDGPSRLFLRRSAALMKASPENWDGIWR